MPLSAPVTRYLRVSLTALLAGALSIGVSGCLVNRVMEVKQQFCDFDSNFTIDFSESPGVHFTHPVILDKDILWLAGADPTSVIRSNEQLNMFFIIEEDVPVPNPDNEIGFELEFTLLGDDFKLKQVRLDPKLNGIFNPDYLDRESILASAQEICQTGLGFGSRSVELDLSDRDIDELPSRMEALELMGPPHALVDGGNGWTWRYRMKGDTSGDNGAQFTVWFDENSQKPLRMESQYAKYRTKADFIAKKVSMNVEL